MAGAVAVAVVAGAAAVRLLDAHYTETPLLDLGRGRGRGGCEPLPHRITYEVTLRGFLAGSLVGRRRRRRRRNGGIRRRHRHRRRPLCASYHRFAVYWRQKGPHTHYSIPGTFVCFRLYCHFCRDGEASTSGDTPS